MDFMYIKFRLVGMIFIVENIRLFLLRCEAKWKLRLYKSLYNLPCKSGGVLSVPIGLLRLVA